jgi:plastocyanin
VTFSRRRVAGLVVTLTVCTAVAIAASASALASGAAVKKCLHPKVTTVSVKEFEYGFTIAPKGAIPCGKVTFKQTNTGSIQHNFDLQGTKSGPLLSAHGSASFTIKLLAPGKYTYLCDVLGHAALGMTGILTVK